MRSKPALGWLALFLFATTAQAERARDRLARSEPSAMRKPKPADVDAPLAVVLAR